MAIFALIGGKENKQIVDNYIEKSLIELTNKTNPTLLFCPYAVNDIEKSIVKFHKLMEGINCNIVDLNLDNLNRFESLLIEADILYIGGGSCDDLVEFFVSKGLDKILFKHQNDDKIFAGSSAGAMLYCKVAMGDKYMFTDNFHNYNYKMLNTLGILNINMCPHYQNEDLIIYNDEIKKYGLNAFGIEEGCCLVIDNSSYYVIKENKTNSVYLFDRNKDYQMIPLYEGIIYEENSGFRS